MNNLKHKTIDSWIIPANPNHFDTDFAFNELSQIDWKQSTNIEKGAIVYIYQSGNFHCITHKCRAVEVNKTESYIDDSRFVIDGINFENYGRYMTLELINGNIASLNLSLSSLQEKGLKGNIRGPRRVPDSIADFIEEKIENQINTELHYSNPQTKKDI